MNIAILFPKLAPSMDGIGDHTAATAAELASMGHDVTILTAEPNPDAIPGVTIASVFQKDSRRSISGIVAEVKKRAPDWLMVQYNPFSYGKWGLNLSLPSAIRAVKRASPTTQVALMVHEPRLVPSDVKTGVMATWQKRQLVGLAKSSDRIMFSIKPWADEYRTWFPDKPVRHLPVGSNMPDLGFDKVDARFRIGLDPSATILGLFGSTHFSKRLDWINLAVRAACEKDANVKVMYVGSGGKKVREMLPGIPLHDAGSQSPTEVSRCFAAMDILLTPFIDGVSTRRGSFFSGLQHGLPTITTVGRLSDTELADQAGRAFLAVGTEDPGPFVDALGSLIADRGLQAKLGLAGRELYYEAYSRPVLTKKLIAILKDTGELVSSDSAAHHAEN